MGDLNVASQSISETRSLSFTSNNKTANWLTEVIHWCDFIFQACKRSHGKSKTFMYGEPYIPSRLLTGFLKIGPTLRDPL